MAYEKNETRHERLLYGKRRSVNKKKELNFIIFQAITLRLNNIINHTAMQNVYQKRRRRFLRLSTRRAPIVRKFATQIRCACLARHHKFIHCEFNELIIEFGPKTRSLSYGLLSYGKRRVMEGGGEERMSHSKFVKQR